MSIMTVISSNTDAHLDPFSGDGEPSLRLEVTRPIDAALFSETLTRRTKVEVQAVLSLGSANRMPSVQYPAVLFVSPGNLNRSLVQSLLDQAPEADSLTNSVPSTSPDAPEILPALTPEADENSQPLLDRLKAGGDLSLGEVNTVLRALLGYPTSATLSATQQANQAATQQAAQDEPAPAAAEDAREPQDAAQTAGEGEKRPSSKK